MKIRLLLALAGILFLGGYGWLAARVHQGRLVPGEQEGGSYRWVLGPSAEAFEEAAGRNVQRGLAALNDSGREPADRLRAYRDELETAERLLVRSLRAQPVQARALAQLAATKWELEPPLTRQALERHLGMLDIASRLAPTNPGVQLQLGELLLAMGRRQESTEYLRRTLELDPKAGRDIVNLLRRNLMTTDEILEAFPRSPYVLAALLPFSFEDRAEAAHLDAMDAALAELAPEVPFELVRTYGSTCIRMKLAEHLQERLTALGSLSDPRAEAERLLQRARAFHTLHDSASALRDAAAAREQQPESAQVAQRHGQMLLESGDADLAIVAFREAIALAARSEGSSRLRARLYREIGRAQEARGDLAQAYDAFKMALRLNPEEPYARKRVDEMEAAAGRR